MSGVYATLAAMSANAAQITSIKHRSIQVNGIKMHIAEQGEGPLIVLAHGWPELWYSWRHVLPALAAAGYHVVAPDMRGYGQTDAPQNLQDYTFGEFEDPFDCQHIFRCDLHLNSTALIPACALAPAIHSSCESKIHRQFCRRACPHTSDPYGHAAQQSDVESLRYASGVLPPRERCRSAKSPRWSAQSSRAHRCLSAPRPCDLRLLARACRGADTFRGHASSSNRRTCFFAALR